MPKIKIETCTRIPAIEMRGNSLNLHRTNCAVYGFLVAETATGARGGHKMKGGKRPRTDWGDTNHVVVE